MKQTYTALDIPTITPTSVNDLICAKKFWTLRVLKQWPPRPPLSFGAFGTAVHAILKEVYDPRNAPLPSLEDLDVWTREAFFRQRYSDEQCRELDMDRAKRMVGGYVYQADGAETVGTIATERLLERPIFHDGKPLFVLSGVVDRMIVLPDDPDTLILLDLKTGRPKVDLWQACVLLALAKLTMPQYKKYVLFYDWLDEGGRVDRDGINTADVKGVWPRIMRRAVEVLTADEHLAEPTDYCTYCPLRADCQPTAGTTIEEVADLFEE